MKDEVMTGKLPQWLTLDVAERVAKRLGYETQRWAGWATPYDALPELVEFARRHGRITMFGLCIRDAWENPTDNRFGPESLACLLLTPAEICECWLRATEGLEKP